MGGRRATGARRAAAVAMVGALLAVGCGSRLPDDVLADIDRAALSGNSALGPGEGVSPSGSDDPAAGAGGPSTTALGGPGGADGGGSGAGGGPSAPGGGGDATGGAGGGEPDPGTEAADCSGGGATDTGVTANQITVAGMVTDSGPLPGATEGSYRGAAAYFAKVNAEGGVCGRTIRILKGDDGLDPQRARSEFLRLEPQVLAFVGNRSVADSGFMDLLERTGVPYLGAPTDPAGRDLPSVVGETDPGVSHTGPYLYYRQAYPNVQNVGFLYTDVGGVRANTPTSREPLKAVGFRIPYDAGLSATSVDYTSNVISMRDRNVQMVFLFAVEVNMHVRLARAMRQQNFNPPLKVAQLGYNSKLIELLGPTANGWTNFNQHLPVLNPDEAERSPAVAEFLRWNQQLFPGAQLDLFPATTWADAALFVEALRRLGGNVTREGVVETVQSITEFDGGGIFAPINPAGRSGSGCFTITRIEGGVWTREHPDSGFECDLGEPLAL